MGKEKQTFVQNLENHPSYFLKYQRAAHNLGGYILLTSILYS